MKSEPWPGAGGTQLRTSAKSFLSIFLSAVFALPTGIALPAPAAAGVRAGEDGHGSAVPLRSADKKPKQDAAVKGLPITELSGDEAIFHALNRLAYGPRPGDMERLRQMGLAKWIEQQLNPNAMDDRAVEARLEQFLPCGCRLQIAGGISAAASNINAAARKHGLNNARTASG